MVLGTVKCDFVYPLPPSLTLPSQPNKIASALLSLGNIYQDTVPNNLLCVDMRESYVALRRPFVGMKGPFVDMRGSFVDMEQLFGLRRPRADLGDPC